MLENQKKTECFIIIKTVYFSNLNQNENCACK